MDLDPFSPVTFFLVKKSNQKRQESPILSAHKALAGPADFHSPARSKKVLCADSGTENARPI